MAQVLLVEESRCEKQFIPIISGVIDGAAYQSERAFKKMLRDNNCPTADVLASWYDGVVLLTSLAVDKPAKYNAKKGSNDVRRETQEQAAKTDTKTETAWRKYFDEQRIKVVGECAASKTTDLPLAPSLLYLLGAIFLLFQGLLTGRPINQRGHSRRC